MLIEIKSRNRNSQKPSRKKKFQPGRPHRDEEAKPFDRSQSRALFAHLRSEKTAKLGEVDFGHMANPKFGMGGDEPVPRTGYDPHTIFTSLRSSSANDNNLGDVLSAFTESSPVSKPFLADDRDPESARDGEGLPGPPQDVIATIVKARFVTLSWQPPVVTNGDILAYSVFYRQEGSER